MSDTLTLPGANRIAMTIYQFWHAQGERVEVRVEPVQLRISPDGKSKDRMSTCYQIKSDMINGLPARRGVANGRIPVLEVTEMGGQDKGQGNNKPAQPAPQPAPQPMPDESDQDRGVRGR